MSLWAFAIYIGIYLMIVVGLTRMRAELGPPIHAIGYLTPQYMMISLLGTRRLRSGQPNDALAHELAQRRELCLLPNPSDAGPVRGV